jgi:hypothetical protein
MAQDIEIKSAHKALKSAKDWIEKHKRGINEVIKAGEATGLPFVIALAEGYGAQDGSGHVEIAGVPVMLIAAAGGTLGAATGWLEEYGAHVGSSAAGCWGAFAADAGRQLGLKLRAKAGKPIQAALLSQHALNDVNKYLAAKNMTLKASDVSKGQGARVGTEQYAQVGAAPVFDAARLDAIADSPTGQ